LEDQIKAATSGGKVEKKENSQDVNDDSQAQYIKELEDKLKTFESLEIDK